MTRHKHVITTLVFSLTLVVAATTVGTAFALPATEAKWYLNNGPEGQYYTDNLAVPRPEAEDRDGNSSFDWEIVSGFPSHTSTTGGANGTNFVNPDILSSGRNNSNALWPAQGMNTATGFTWFARMEVRTEPLDGNHGSVSIQSYPSDATGYFNLEIGADHQGVEGIGDLGPSGPGPTGNGINTANNSFPNAHFFHVAYEPGQGYWLWRNNELLNNYLPTPGPMNPSTTSLPVVRDALEIGPALTRNGGDDFDYRGQTLFDVMGVIPGAYLPVGCIGDANCDTLNVVEPSGSLWEIGTPITSYGHGPGANFGDVTPAKALELAENGFNMVWAQHLFELDNAHAQGLRAMYWAGGYTDDPAVLDDPVRTHGLNVNIDNVKDHPAMYAYHMADEPSATEFEDYGRLAAHIRERDPNHMIYINLFPTYASDVALLGPGAGPGSTTQAYREYLRQFVLHVKPDVISYDHYHFRDGHDRDEYFLNLALVREAALNADIPFINYVQAVSLAPSGWRVPTPNEGRFLAYTTLAYGGQGLTQFTYYGYSDFEGGVYDPYPPGDNITPLGEALRDEINPAFVAVAEQVQPLKSIGAYHVGTQPEGTELLPNDSPFDVLSPTTDILVGLFGGPDAQLAEATYALVVNLDYTNPNDALVSGPGELSVFDASTGVWSPMGSDTVLLSLLPGGGKLVGFLDETNTDFTWNAASGDWNVAGNWTGFFAPPGKGSFQSNHTVTFADSIGSDTRTVFTDEAVTLNSISFDNTIGGSYVIAGGASINLTVSTEEPATLPSISVAQGSHRFQAPVSILSDTSVDVASNSVLIFDGALDLMGNTLTKTGAGEMAIRNDLLTGGGTVDIQQGTLSGSGTVGGDVNNGGTVSPGNSAGWIAVEGNFNQGEDGTLAIELAGTTAVTEYDQLQVNGQATVAGILEVSLLDGFEPAFGDTFNILEFGSLAGEFDNVVVPALSGSLAWDDSALLTEGMLSVVPEPTGLVMAVMGLVAVVGLGRRRGR